MPFPSFTEIKNLPEFQELDVSEQERLTTKYWDDFSKENPDVADYEPEYFNKQRDESIALVKTRAQLKDASPIERRFLEDTADELDYNVVVRDGLKFGHIKPEEFKEIQAERLQQIAPRKQQLQKLEAFFSEDGNKSIAALGETARDGAIFTPEKFKNKIGFSDRSTEEYAGMYETMREGVSERYGLKPEEIDDIVKHSLDAQTDPVSRDALGNIHYKNDLLFQGEEAAIKAINETNLPISVKEKAIKDFKSDSFHGEFKQGKYDQFKEGVVNSVIQNHPELAKKLDIRPDNGYAPNFDKLRAVATDSIVANEALSFSNTIIKGTTGAVRTIDKVTDYVDPFKFTSKFISGSISELITGKKPENEFVKFTEAVDKENETLRSIVQISNEFNKEKLKIFGASGGVIGQGLGSVVETVALGGLTKSLLPKIANPKAFGTFINNMSSVAPTVGVMAGRQGLETFERAKGMGMTDAEATELGVASFLTEAVVTLAASGLGKGGLEDFATGIGREVLKGGVKSVTGQMMKRGGGMLLSEQLEEQTINALNAALVETKLNPNMTVEDFKQGVVDTAVATLFSTFGPASIEAAKARIDTKTHNKTVPELEKEADAANPEVAEVLNEDLQAEATALEEQIATLPPDSDERIALEERLTEVREELPATNDELSTETAPNTPEVASSDVVEETVTEPRISEETVTPPTETVTEPDLVEETVTGEPQSEESVNLGSFEDSRKQNKTRHQEENANKGEFGVTLNELENKWESQNVNLRLSETKDGNIELEVIRVDENEQRQGKGSNVISDIKKLADETGKSVELLPVPVGNNTVEDLERFYEKNGFTPYDRGTTPSGKARQRGYRYTPSNQPQQSPAQAETPTDTLPEGQTTPTGNGAVAATIEQEPAQIPTEDNKTSNVPPTTPPPPRNESPDAEPIPEPESVGVRKSMTTAIRRKAGLLEDPTIRIEGETKAAIIAADEEIKNDPDVGRRVVKSLEASGRPATVRETAILSFELTKAVNELEAAEKTNATPDSDEAVRRDNLAREEQARLRIDQLTTLILSQGRAKSLALNAQKILRRKNYSFEGMYSRALAAKNKGAAKKQTLTKEEVVEIKDKAKKIEMSDKELAAAVAEAYAEGRLDAEREAAENAKKQVRGSKKTTEEKKAEKKAYNEKRLAEARKKIRDSLSRSNTGIDPTLIPEYVVVISDYIRKGINKLVDIKNKLIADFGKGADAYAEAAYDEALTLANAGLPKTPAQLVAEMDADKPINRRSVAEIVKQYYQEDIKLTSDEVVTKLQKELSAKWPNVTRAQVSDAWTGYGQEATTPQTRSDLNKAIANSRRAAQLTREIQDLESGSYKGKRKPASQVTEEVKELTKERNRLLREGKINLEEKTILAIKKTTQKYLDRIKNGDFKKEKKSPLETQKVKEAQYELDKVKADFDRYAQELALKTATRGQKIKHKLLGLAEFRKLFILGLDVMFFRQGIWSFVTRPIRTTGALVRAIANSSEKNSQILYNDLVNPEVSPNAAEYNQIKSFKLFSPFSKDVANREDLPDFEVLEKLEKVYGIGKIATFIKAIERTNRNLHNLIATDTYNAITAANRDGRADFVTKQVSTLAANAAMKMVGRGDSTKPKREAAIPVLNMILLSTRYYMARFASVIGSPVWSPRAGYGKDTARVRYEIAKQMYGKLLFNMSVVMAIIYNLMDDEEEKRAFIDPTSPTFGKTRVGGSEYEIINSFRPFINVIARTTLGYVYKDGEATPIRGEGSNRFTQSVRSEWQNFFWNRRNINTAYITDIINGQFYGGEPVTTKSMITNLIGNINVRNDWEILNEDDTSTLQKIADITLIHLGAGVEADPDKFKREK